MDQTSDLILTSIHSAISICRHALGSLPAFRFARRSQLPELASLRMLAELTGLPVAESSDAIQVTESGFRKFMGRLRRRGGKAPFLCPEDAAKKPAKAPLVNDERPAWVKQINQPTPVPEDLDLSFLEKCFTLDAGLKMEAVDDPLLDQFWNS